MKTIIAILLLNTYSIDGIIEVLKIVETQGKATEIGDNGRAYGILQIHKECVIDVNRVYGTNYVHSDAFKESVAEDIFKKYISIGISYYKKRYNKEPTEEDVVRMWNGGCYSGYLYPSTKKYYNKYLAYKNKVLHM